jgi:hypothetical protein
MSSWQHSTISLAKLIFLADAGLLLPMTYAREWIKPKLEDFPQPPPRYVASFITFHEHGFLVPAVRFIRAVLRTYGLELHHLNPNDIQHLAAF